MKGLNETDDAAATTLVTNEHMRLDLLCSALIADDLVRF